MLSAGISGVLSLNKRGCNTMGQITGQIDVKLDEISRRGGTPTIINTGPGGENKIRQELEDNSLIAPDSKGATACTVDESTLYYRNLPVIERHSEYAGFLSITFSNSNTKQEEL